MPGRMRDPGTLNLTAILKGLIVSFAILIIASIILGTLFSIIESMSGEFVNRSLLVMNYLSIFIGGLVTARSARAKGWLNGGVVGLGYMLIIVIVGSQMVTIGFSLDIILRICSGFIAGGVGGAIGVNIN